MCVFFGVFLLLLSFVVVFVGFLGEGGCVIFVFLFCLFLFCFGSEM